VLVPALVLGVLWDRSGIELVGSGGIYSGSVPNASILSTVLPSLRWPVFFGNLFFLQTIAVPSLGSNGPLWSLSNEFWYYIMFPLGLLALWPGRTAGRRWLYLLAFSAIVALVGIFDQPADNRMVTRRGNKPPTKI
jgi:peptidoglycan/LPS O-acetylase OafA/YrhL